MEWTFPRIYYIFKFRNNKDVFKSYNVSETHSKIFMWGTLIKFRKERKKMLTINLCEQYVHAKLYEEKREKIPYKTRVITISWREEDIITDAEIARWWHEN